MSGWKWTIFASRRPCFPALKRGWSYLHSLVYMLTFMQLYNDATHIQTIRKHADMLSLSGSSKCIGQLPLIFFAYMYLYLNIYFGLVLFSLEGVWGWLIPTVQAVVITDGVEEWWGGQDAVLAAVTLVSVTRIVSLKHWISSENYKYEAFVSMNNNIFWYKMYSSGHCFPEHWNYWYRVYSSGKKKRSKPSST